MSRAAQVCVARSALPSGQEEPGHRLRAPGLGLQNRGPGSCWALSHGNMAGATNSSSEWQPFTATCLAGLFRPATARAAGKWQYQQLQPGAQQRLEHLQQAESRCTDEHRRRRTPSRRPASAGSSAFCGRAVELQWEDGFLKFFLTKGRGIATLLTLPCRYPPISGLGPAAPEPLANGC